MPTGWASRWFTSCSPSAFRPCRSAPGRDRLVSRCLIAASVLLPGGFFAGGVVYYAGDPGPGILLVPVGAFLLLTAVFLVARATKQMDRADGPPDRPRKN